MSVFIVLGLVWAAVLLPPVFRARAGRRAEFIDSFREQMGALDQGRDKVAAAPPRFARASQPKKRVSPVQRRRDILGGILGAMIGSLVLGAVPSLHAVWFLFLFLLNTFLGYVALLAQQRKPARARHPLPVQAKPARERRADRRERAAPAPALDLTP